VRSPEEVKNLNDTIIPITATQVVKPVNFNPSENVFLRKAEGRK
jgi:hypothetical protein